jgi:hypothetical protein
MTWTCKVITQASASKCISSPYSIHAFDTASRPQVNLHELGCFDFLCSCYYSWCLMKSAFHQTLLVWSNHGQGAAVAQLVEALRYKPIPDGVIGFFHCHNPVGRTMALESTQPLTKMSTSNLSWRVSAAGANGWQPTTFLCRLFRNLGASTSWNPQDLSRPVMGYLYLYKSRTIRWTWYTTCIGEGKERLDRPRRNWIIKELNSNLHKLSLRMQTEVWNEVSRVIYRWVP